MGTPTSDFDLGAEYARDFLEFLQKTSPDGNRALEIGAGIGYLSFELNKSGWHTDSIEPGQGYRKYWEKYGLKVINEFFPSDKAQGPYDLIFFYAVLEHIPVIESFLRQVTEHLSPEGVVVLAVPDCSSEIEAGDPSMILHEHYHYFTSTSLRRNLLAAGLNPHIQNSGYGRSIYAIARPIEGDTAFEAPSSDEILVLKSYPEKVEKLKKYFTSRLYLALKKGSVGIYCPARALSLLPADIPVRFFDDACDLHGKYYPPFKSLIENRDDLISCPVDTLFIMTRTFCVRIADELTPILSGTKIYTIEDLLENV